MRSYAQPKYTQHAIADFVDITMFAVLILFGFFSFSFVASCIRSQ